MAVETTTKSTTTAGAVAEQAPSRAAALAPLAVDVAAPIGAYYLAHTGLGLSLVASLAIGSAIPAVRTVAGLLKDRSLNALAGLMLVVNLVGIALSALTGDARLMIAKDGLVSSVIGGTMIVTALVGRPLMTAGLRPFLIRGSAARAAAWERLAAGSDRFRRLERSFTLTWGTVLVAECAAKVVGAYTLPVETMVWMGTVFLAVAIGLGIVVGNRFAGRMGELVAAEARTPVDTALAA
ncbi:VC0807 family protein [Kitasatospora camelliae]|uniref:VC0807 family protein n=1 Tax=Kitasatospora camelliae TaxID=3156397 RepID=A0AAU8JWF5_9ACTN